MTINFKSGRKEQVEDRVVKTINEKLTAPGGSSAWQFFSDENGRCIYAVNLSEVESITDENIMP